MKYIIFLVALVSLASCSKERVSPIAVGTHVDVYLHGQTPDILHVDFLSLVRVQITNHDGDVVSRQCSVNEDTGDFTIYRLPISSQLSYTNEIANATFRFDGSRCWSVVRHDINACIP